MKLTKNKNEKNDLPPSDEALARQFDTFLHIQTEEIQRDGKDTYHHHRYEPTPYRVLQELFTQLSVTENDTILDYGSGLGRLCFFANYEFHCSCIGVEFSEIFHRKAEQNLSNYCGVHKKRIQFVHESAEKYVIPDSVRFIYCFNPFSTDVFRYVLSNIERSFEQSPREIMLLLYYPEDDTIFYIERHTSFCLTKEFPIPSLFENDRRERFCVYSMANNGSAETV